MRFRRSCGVSLPVAELLGCSRNKEDGPTDCFSKGGGVKLQGNVYRAYTLYRNIQKPKPKSDVSHAVYSMILVENTHSGEVPLCSRGKSIPGTWQLWLSTCVTYIPLPP